MTDGTTSGTERASDQRDTMDSDRLVAALANASAHADSTTQGVQVIETHISWIVLTDRFAYKVKKPIHNAFLDYSTLSKRKTLCEQELRLNRRYAPGLYLDVVPITADGEDIHVDGHGEAVEYAVKMHRFSETDELEHRLEADLVTSGDIEKFAKSLARIHLQADRATPDQQFGHAFDVLRQSTDNIVAVIGSPQLEQEDADQVTDVLEWTNWYFELYQSAFDERLNNGYIRECHGDLHVGNIVFWDGQLRPFDGIEFNPEFRWIDVLSDIGFLAMDLLAKHQVVFARLLVNGYLEFTGDYASLALLRWYMVYRAMVRAKVATLRLRQLSQNAPEIQSAKTDLAEHLQMAARLIRQPKPGLWITHGLSGSGKSTGARTVIRERGAIHLRSDVERKRLFGLALEHRPSGREAETLYSSNVTERVYARLLELARGLLSAGYSVVVDATFLRRRQRSLFQELARDLGADYRILSFETDLATLKSRLQARAESGQDVSDADVHVLRHQMESSEPLTDAEMECATLNPQNVD